MALQESVLWEQTVLQSLENLIPHSREQSYLLALSGGMDSVALLRLLHNHGFRLVVAHVNYGLRGEESDGDQEFCRQLCADLQLPFHDHAVESSAFRPGLSVQAVAREIRYTWFEELRTRLNLDYILTGHHRDDQAETVVMQALRRKAFKIFQPIAPLNGLVVRPLLGVTRAGIRNWMEEKAYTWREDSSNAEDIYLRNRVRHHIIPELLQVQPSLLDHMEERVTLYQAQYRLLEKYIQPRLPEFCSRDGEVQVIRVDRLQELFETEASAVLSWLLDQWGEPHSIQNQVIRLMGSGTGKKVVGLAGAYFRDRERILLTPIQAMPEEKWLVPGTESAGFNGFTLHFREFAAPRGFVPSRDPNILTMDASRVRWPLQIRTWQPGDKMKPLGMEGNRLVSDILTGLKLPPPVREKAFVLCSEGKILYVQEYRISNKVRYRKDSRRLLEIRIQRDSHS